MRRLLVQAAHAALRSRQDWALKHWAERPAQRVGKQKAVVERDLVDSVDTA